MVLELLPLLLPVLLARSKTSILSFPRTFKKRLFDGFGTPAPAAARAAGQFQNHHFELPAPLKSDFLVVLELLPLLPAIGFYKDWHQVCEKGT